MLESATVLSVLSEDMASFERSVIQLKVYYGSLAAELSPSELHYPILGTRLLQLLVENRMAEFHNEVRFMYVLSYNILDIILTPCWLHVFYDICSLS